MYKFNDVEMWMPFYCCSMTKIEAVIKKQIIIWIY